MIKMIKKELYFIATKHWITITVAVFILIITGSLNNSQTIETPKVAVLMKGFADSLYNNIENELEVKVVTSLEEGKQMVHDTQVDAFVYIENEDIIILRDEKRIQSYYVKPIIQSVISPSEIELKYVQLDESDQTFDNLFFMFALVCFALPPLLFRDDWEVLKLILLSPIRNMNIVLSKMIASSSILLLITLLYLYMIDNMKFNLFIGIFIIGLLYTSIGTFFGVFVENKYLEYLTYPLVLIVMILPLLSNSISSFLNNTLRLYLTSDIILSINLFILIAIFLIITLLDVYLFGLRIRRMKE